MNNKSGLDIISLLSPETRRRMDEREAEARRICALADAELAQEIVCLARSARDLHPDQLPRGPDVSGDTYTTTLFYDVVPEIARRLGGIDVLANEVVDEISSLDDRSLEEWALDCLRRTALSPRSPSPGGPDPWEVLRDGMSADYNPVVEAAGRMRPALRFSRRSKPDFGP